MADTRFTTDSNLSERFSRAVSLVESSPQQCIILLETVQKDVQTLSLFSKNETMDDVSTKSIQFLTTEHFLAIALGHLPVVECGAITMRKANILRSSVLWESFLQKLERLESLSKEETEEFHSLLEIQQQNHQGKEDESIEHETIGLSIDRDLKISRFKAKRQQRHDIEKLSALRDRRNRFGLSSEDDLDGVRKKKLKLKVLFPHNPKTNLSIRNPHSVVLFLIFKTNI